MQMSMLDMQASRVSSNALASCSTPCALHVGVRKVPRIHAPCMVRQELSASRRQTSMMASEKKGGGSFNPFRNRQNENAAKKALEEMFGGKEDVLAAYDAGGGNSGKGGGRKGGGGGREGADGEGSSFEFRRWLKGLADSLGKTGRSLVKTMAAVLLLLSIFLASAFVQPAFRAAVRGVRWLLRLDGAGSRRARRQPTALPAQSATTLGENERSILAKYAQDDDEDMEEQQPQQAGSGDQEDDEELD